MTAHTNSTAQPSAALKPEGVPVPDCVRFSPYAPGDTGYFIRKEDLPEFDPKRGVE